MDHFDNLETRAPDVREASLLSNLPGLIARAIASAPGWAEQLAAIDASAISSRAALADLPLLRKSELHERQANNPPFGGFTTSDPGAMARIFVSPGPIYEPQGQASDFWGAARALHAAGFRAGELAYNTFSYHLTPGGWILDSGLRALGCAVVPAGIGNTEQQIAALVHLRPSGFTGVPDFLKILLDKADDAGTPVTSIRKALVSGGALFPSLRQDYRNRGIAVLQAYATAEAGVISYESELGGELTGGMIVNEGVLVEIVRPGTGDPVPEGDVGEVVVTCFNRDYPMIRLATGDLSAVLPGASACGRTNMRLRGWMGRADQTTKVKGMFVHPGQIAGIAKRHPELGRVRLEVARDGEQDIMTLKAESASVDPALMAAIESTLREATKLKGAVELVAPGSLPNDGKVIADERNYNP